MIPPGAKTRIDAAEAYFHWRPHPTQRLWLLNEGRVKVASCGRRWGKTESQAIDAATFAMLRPRSRQMIVSPTYDQSRLIFDSVERVLLSSPQTRRMVKVTRSPYPRILFRGSLIMARTADEDGRNLRGHSADRVMVDEAAYVKDRVIEEVIGPMLADRDGQLIMISTPFGKNHFYRAFLQGQEGGKRCASFRFPSWENPHISREYVERQREALSARQFSVEYEAEFLDDQNSVFPWSDIQAAIGPLPAQLSEGESWRTAGVDWARYADYTAAVVVEAGAAPNTVVAIDRFNNMNWQTQIERVADFLQRHCVNVALTDQTSIGDPLLERLRDTLWQDRGANVDVQGMTFTNTGKREMIDNLVVRLAHRDLTIPNDERLLREMQYYEYELTDSGNVRMNAKSGYTDDLVVALGLAVMAARSAPLAGARFLSSGRSRTGGRW
ncbi:MAG: terminase family protein [Armatimonadota bacterium]|nr:terminase family protein [Armatimonadota bacterium]